MKSRAHMGLKEPPFPEVLRRWWWGKGMKNVGNHIHEKRQAEQMTKIAVVSPGRI